MFQQKAPLYGEQRPILKAIFMSTESEFGRWNQIDKMKLIALILAMFIGGALGVLTGFYIPLIACGIFDYFTKPEPGGGVMNVGWLICILTVPIGAIAGGSFGFLFALNPRKYIKKKFQPEAPLYGEQRTNFRSKRKAP